MHYSLNLALLQSIIRGKKLAPLHGISIPFPAEPSISFAPSVSAEKLLRSNKNKSEKLDNLNQKLQKSFAYFQHCKSS